MSLGTGCGTLDKATQVVMFEFQTPATLNQAAPVQNTWYPILGTLTEGVDFVRLISLWVSVAGVGETLETRIVLDGVTLTNSQAAAAGTPYRMYHPDVVAGLGATVADSGHISFMLEGHNVAIAVRKTTANGAGAITAEARYGVLNYAS